MAFQGIKRHPYGSQSKNETITQFCFNVGSASNTIDRHWSSNGLQRWPNIEPVLGGLAYTLCVPGTSYRRVHWFISDGGGRNRPTRWRYTCFLGSFNNNYILDILEILAHEENQYSYVYKKLGKVLSKAFKQTKQAKAGPRSSGNLFLVQIFTPLCLATATHNVKWVKITHICNLRPNICNPYV